jgi:enoyl-CoA hydratase/carnithine racemase
MPHITMSILTQEQRGGALILRMNRPEVMNALSRELVTSIMASIEAVESLPSVRAVILTSTSDKAFSAGTDLKERAELDDRGKAEQSQLLTQLGTAIRECSKPVVAAIGGWCLGGGCELAMFCDVRIAASDARFGFPEMTLGAYPGSGGAVLLPKLIGTARAKYVLFTALRFDAVTAHSWGLVQRVIDRGILIDTALAWCAEVERTAPLAIAALKRSMNETEELNADEAFSRDQMHRRPLDATSDYAEGARAFKEKRTPKFVGH